VGTGCPTTGVAVPPDRAQRTYPIGIKETGMLAERMLPRALERLATINAGSPLREAADLMSRPRTDFVVVCDDDGAMVGVLTKTDIVRHVRHCVGEGCAAARADTIMTRDVVACRPGDVLHDVWTMMKERGLRCIPVLDQGRKPIGIIHGLDALQSLLSEVEYEETLLRDYVMDVGYR
jgi:CBS domain-containing protein